jgi:capsular polysaccharide biosynthesis protein
VFLFRGRSRSRALRNSDELAAALIHSFGFESVDTDDLTYDEQASLFADARFVVATHGAGLTNLIHRIGAPATLLELFPSDYVHPHFAWLARTAGFDYSGLAGTMLDSRTQTFEIPTDLVLAKVETIDPGR